MKAMRVKLSRYKFQAEMRKSRVPSRATKARIHLAPRGSREFRTDRAAVLCYCKIARIIVEARDKNIATAARVWPAMFTRVGPTRESVSLNRPRTCCRLMRPSSRPADTMYRRRARHSRRFEPIPECAPRVYLPLLIVSLAWRNTSRAVYSRCCPTLSSTAVRALDTSASVYRARAAGCSY